MALRNPETLTEDEVMRMHDGNARKDTAISFRVSSQELALIKKAASQDGYSKYQTWVRDKLSQSVAGTLGIENDADDE